MTAAKRLILFDTAAEEEAAAPEESVTGRVLAADPNGELLMADDGSGGGTYLAAD